MLAAQIIWYTPIWVWLLFFGLLYLGLKRVRTQIRTLRGLLLVPAIFVVWGGFGLYQGGITQRYIPWLLAFFAGATIALVGRFYGQLKFSDAKIVVTGSIWPLLRMQSIFWAHYVLHVLAILKPEQSTQYLALDVYVSGASAGYFFGYGLALWRALQRLPRFEASSAVAPPNPLDNPLLP